MGARGPQRVPTEILKARGSRKVEGREGEVRYTRGCPPCPPALAEYLEGRAKEEWDALVPELEAAGILQTVDKGLLVSYCVCLANLEWTLTVFPPTQLSVRVQNFAIDSIHRLAAHFGLSPSTRSRVKMADPAEEDPLSKFLGGGPQTLPIKHA